MATSRKRGLKGVAVIALSIAACLCLSACELSVSSSGNVSLGARTTERRDVTSLRSAERAYRRGELSESQLYRRAWATLNHGVGPRCEVAIRRGMIESRTERLALAAIDRCATDARAGSD